MIEFLSSSWITFQIRAHRWLISNPNLFEHILAKSRGFNLVRIFYSHDESQEDLNSITNSDIKTNKQKSDIFTEITFSVCLDLLFEQKITSAANTVTFHSFGINITERKTLTEKL